MDEPWWLVVLVVFSFPAFVVGLRLLGWWYGRKSASKGQGESKDS